MPSVQDQKFQSRESGSTLSTTEMEQVWPENSEKMLNSRSDSNVMSVDTKPSTASSTRFSVASFFQSRTFGDGQNKERYFGQTTRNLFTWECIVLAALLAVPASLAILACSASGLGIENYSWLATSNKQAMNWYYIFAATMLMIFVGIIFDIYQVWYYAL